MELIDLRVEKDGSGSGLSLEVGSGSEPDRIPNSGTDVPGTQCQGQHANYVVWPKA
jgi:hypothetical protein